MGEFEKKIDKRDYIIDIFRIVAILMVLSVHIRDYLKDVLSIINTIFGFGAYGVALYFMISGYLSYSSVEKSKGLTEYYFKKAVRILPTYYISLFLTFVFDVFVLEEKPLSPLWSYHIVFANMFIPSIKWEWWNSVNFFWTMPSFIAWYIISPIIFRYLNNSKKVAVISLVFSIIAPILKEWMYNFASNQFVNWNFFSLLYVFLFGVLGWFIIQEKKYLIGICYAFFIGFFGWIVGNRSGFFAFGLFFYILVIIAVSLEIRITSLTVKKIIKFLSNISYSVYLTHYFVLKVGVQMWSGMPWILSYGLFLSCSVIIGSICYLLIEKPIGNILSSIWKRKHEDNILIDV